MNLMEYVFLVERERGSKNSNQQAITLLLIQFGPNRPTDGPDRIQHRRTSWHQTNSVRTVSTSVPIERPPVGFQSQNRSGLNLVRSWPEAPLTAKVPFWLGPQGWQSRPSYHPVSSHIWIPSLTPDLFVSFYLLFVFRIFLKYDLIVISKEYLFLTIVWIIDWTNCFTSNPIMSKSRYLLRYESYFPSLSTRFWTI